jgi:hypothetical protein
VREHTVDDVEVQIGEAAGVEKPGHCVALRREPAEVGVSVLDKLWRDDHLHVETAVCCCLAASAGVDKENGVGLGS